MASEEELIAIKVAIKDAQKAVREAHRVAAGVDEIGDEAEQTSRKADKAARSIMKLSAASSTTRVNLGPFSTSMRGATLVVGGMVIAAEKLTPVVLSAAEAVATLAGGGAAAGGVGLLALVQASTVAKLGMSDLSDALGGNEEAARNLSLEQYLLYRRLTDSKEALQDIASAAMLPGLERGGRGLLRNMDVFRGIVRDTGRELGRLAGDGGEMFGSDAWGRDIRTVGKANVEIVGDLGDAGLHLADAARHILVEAAPLAKWMAENAKDGAAAAEAWAEGARKGGDLRRFFADAKTDIRLFGESVDHVADGLGNLFGNQDVDGTKFLENIERATERFERWTDSPAVRNDFGEAIRTEVADGVAAAAGAAAETLPGAAGRAAEVFWDSFWAASPEGKALIAILSGAKIAGAIRGSTPLTPMFVKEVGASLPGKGGSPTGGGKKLPPWLLAGGARAATAGASVALPAGLIAALALGNNHDYPSGAGAGGTRHGREEEGRPARDNRAAFERVMDPGEFGPARQHPLNPPGAFEPIIPVTVKIGEDTIAKQQVRARAKVDARRR
jgi:hypothetical protein